MIRSPLRHLKSQTIAVRQWPRVGLGINDDTIFHIKYLQAKIRAHNTFFLNYIPKPFQEKIVSTDLSFLTCHLYSVGFSIIIVVITVTTRDCDLLSLC